MRRSLVKFSGPEASNHTPSLAVITTTSGFELSVHTPDIADQARHVGFVPRRDIPTIFISDRQCAQLGLDSMPLFQLDSDAGGAIQQSPEMVSGECVAGMQPDQRGERRH